MPLTKVQTGLLEATGTPDATTFLRGDGAWAVPGSGGTLAVSSGGTGQTSYTDGQLLIGNSTGNTLTKTTLTQGTGITITNGAGAITIAASGGGGGGNTQMSYAVYPTTVFNSTGTPMVNTGTGTFNWTCPTGVTKVMVSVIGGGGGGVACGGGNGGTGGTAIGIYTVTPSTVYSVTVGNGGTGNIAGNNNGTSGGSSSFSTLATATGGGGANVFVPISGSGGTGSGGNIKNSVSASGTSYYINSHLGLLGIANTIYFPINFTSQAAAPTNWSTSSLSAPGAAGDTAYGSGGISGIVLITYVG
jgi:hypothetical protein